MAGSSSYPSHMYFDVFLSINKGRRKDDKYIRFTKQLHESLCRWGMKVFMDDDDVDSVSDNILKAIKGSKTSIVVLSNGYVSSRKCVRQLTAIQKTAHQILPLFYHGEYTRDSGTSYVRIMERFFRIDQKPEKWNIEHRWRDALSQICSLPGEVVETPMILPFPSSLMKSIFDKLMVLLQVEAKRRYLLEMPLRLRTIEMLLGVGSNDVRCIGIVGMGGIGKTIIAQLLYDKFASTFGDDQCCLLRIVGQSVVSLQQQLLFQLSFTKDDTKTFEDPNEGLQLIKNCFSLSRRPMFLIFDGISEKCQLEMLVGDLDWFSAGTRIIITTRNKDILRQINFKDNVHEYNVELLSHTSAISLFYKHAFEDHSPPNQNFEKLSIEIVERVGRLPLALEKIGSSLKGKGIHIWEDTLKCHPKVVYDNIFPDVLKSSYEGLEAESQQIFLDLACFFNREKVDRVIEILQGFGYTSPHTTLQLLADRCLIDISDEHIQIHITILCSAQELVRRELGTRQQSRICQRGDARLIFRENYELKSIHGIMMDFEEEEEEEEELVLRAQSFADMSELKILQINNVQLSEDIEYLSNKLTLLNWPGYPSKYLPSTFQPPPLLQLLLPGSNVKRLWNGTKKFANLKEIDASDSKYLVETPDFSEVRNLRRLILRNCGRLHTVNQSINGLRHLVLLDMEGCVIFTRFSFAINCRSLKTLVLSNSGLKVFPKFRRMEYLTELHVDGTSINQLSPSITFLTALVLLNLRNCIRLSSLPTEIGSLSSLKTLILNGCKKLDKIPPSLENVKPLEDLDIGGTSITVIPFLENLKILKCEKLESNIWNLLARLPTHYFRSLEYLNLSDCNLVEEDIPNDLQLFSSLEILDLSFNHFERLPESIQQLINLKALYLNDCHKLKQVHKLPESLQYVGGEMPSDMLRHSQGSSATTTSYLPSSPPMIPFVPCCKTLVGIENQVGKVCNLLDLERSDEVLVVGIFGLDGIGKTSIVEVVYNTIAFKFEGTCFICNSKQNNHLPLVSKEVRNWDDDHTEQEVKDLLIHKKVLIVLDGVDERNQIEKLVGSLDWFAHGSRVIITSRNKDVLDRLNYRDKVKEYNVELLSHENAYSLFCNNAFEDGCPSDEHDLCNAIVEKVRGFPLALTTIGAYLNNKDPDVWNETLKRLDDVEEDFFDTILQRNQKKTTPTLGQT